MQDLLHTLTTATAGVVGRPFLDAFAAQVAASLEAEAAFVVEGAETDVEAELVLPLTGPDGSEVGRLAVVSPRRELDADDRQALELLAARAGAEIERQRAEADVAASRMRIVQAAEEERRRIGRTLHDGAQQRLVAIGHFLDVARKKMGDSAPDAAPIVERAAEEARETGRELRELSRGLNPAMLAEHGLGVALTTVAGNCPLDVALEAVPEERLPDPVETALYYVVSAALADAPRHAGTTRVQVRVERRGDSIRACLEDDGDAPAAEKLPAFEALTDRLAAIGGALRVESPDGGGTRLVAEIPADPWTGS
ncbi:MAG: sensor histidine kinase [Gaiellaceae bacterium]